MTTMTAADLLGAWERGLAQPPARRAVGLLAAACPGSTPQAIARLPVGRRDALLLALRVALFGPDMAGVATCADCGEQVELSFDARDLCPSAAGSAEPIDYDSFTIVVDVDGYRVTARLPTSDDLNGLEAVGDVDAAARLIFQRCVVAAERNGTPADATRLPEPVFAAVSVAVAEADPHADIALRVACPACGRAWRETFDVATFLWSEVHRWAVRLLRDVHELARGYGWRESDVLALSPWRRQAYLEMLDG